MTAIKSQVRIFARSPFFINCVPTGGQTITSATVDVTIQTGSRSAAVTSMTDLKAYTLTKTNAVDGIIVFDIAPLIADYFDHGAETLDDTALAYPNTQQIVFVKVEKSVVDTGTTTATETYYVAVDGYSKTTEGVNYGPVTTATGNYGSPAWSPTTAKRTERTIAATDCYRQIGEDSYGLIPIYMGEFDSSATDSITFARVKFGTGEDWKTYSAAEASTVHDYAIVASDSRLTDVRNGAVYIPVGKQNMAGNWVTGYDYLRVGHMIDRAYTDSGKELLTQAYTPNLCTSTSSGANLAIDALAAGVFSEGEGYDFSPGDTVSVTILAFTDCTVAWPETTFTASYQSFVSGVLTLSIPGANQLLVDCFASTVEDTSITVTAAPIIEQSNDIAILNDNPILRYEIICEPKYNVIDCLFINKWGFWDCFSFLKKSATSLSVTSSTYRKNIAVVSASAYTYDDTDNSTQRHQVQGRKLITVNTGYVDESFSLLLQEMMMSERIVLVIDDEFTPVNIKTESVELKKHVNDKLINYTVEFEYANDEINVIG